MKQHVKNELFMGAVVGAVCSFIVVGAISLNRDTERWEKFKRDHHCVLVARIPGDTGFGVSANGQPVVTQGFNRDGWRCDDGVTYYR